MGCWSHESKWGVCTQSDSTLGRRRRSGWLISSEGDKMEEFCIGFLLQGNKSPSILKKNLHLALNERLVLLQRGKKIPFAFHYRSGYVLFFFVPRE